jgi:hypothetical protein
VTMTEARPREALSIDVAAVPSWVCRADVPCDVRRASLARCVRASGFSLSRFGGSDRLFPFKVIWDFSRL